MKQLLTFVLFILSSTLSFATHNRGGVITYRHISGFTYEATITTYTRASVQADRCALKLDWGDGTSDTLNRVNGPTGTCPNAKMGEQLGNDVQKNTYVGMHTYATQGLYMLSTSDPNRNAGINNIPQSVAVPITLNSLLLVDAGTTASSAQFLADPLMNFELGKDCTFNPAAFSPDGDVLSYSLTDPIGASAPVTGSIPNGASINAKTGELSWIPQNIGQYVFAIQVSVCRNNVNLGYVTLDIQINVIASTFRQSFNGLSAWPTDSNGNYSTTIAPGNSLNLNLSYVDSVAPTIDLNGYGEAFSKNNPASFSINSSTPFNKAGTLFWQPTSGDQRCAPYLFTFRGISSSQTHLLEKDISLLVYVRDSSQNYCDTICSTFLSATEVEHKIKAQQVEVWPNPFTSEVNFELSSDEQNRKHILTLYDFNGRRVVEEYFEGDSFLLPRENLAPGIYFYYISGTNGGDFSGKLIISSD